MDKTARLEARRLVMPFKVEDRATVLADARSSVVTWRVCVVRSRFNTLLPKRSVREVSSKARRSGIQIGRDCRWVRTKRLAAVLVGTRFE